MKNIISEEDYDELILGSTIGMGLSFVNKDDYSIELSRHLSYDTKVGYTHWTTFSIYIKDANYKVITSLKDELDDNLNYDYIIKHLKYDK